MGKSIFLLLLAIWSSSVTATDIDSSLMESVFEKVNDELSWMSKVDEEYVIGHPRMATTEG